MNAQNEENLKELFEKFVDTKQAEGSVEDIREGDEILFEHAAPEPDKELIADIKAKIARAVLRRRAGGFKRRAYKIASVAAVFIVLAAIGVKLFESGSRSERFVTASIIPRAIWDSNNIVTDDEDLATLTAEIEQIEGELLALQLGENGRNVYGDLVELEMELIEIDSDFWKG